MAVGGEANGAANGAAKGVATGAASRLTPEQVAAKFGDMPVERVIERVTAAAAAADFDKLCGAVPQFGMHRYGLRANDHCAASEVFKAHRVIPHNGVSRPTLYAVWRSPEYLRPKLFATVARLFGDRDIDSLSATHVVTAYKLQHGCISLFRPMAAKYMFDRYSPRGRVLDFCAGWGGRLLGALATPRVVSYVGIDSNADMAAVYDAMRSRFNPRGAQVSTLLQPAEDVDFGKVGRFDCVLTSPPYYGVEVYRNMPRYASHADWLRRFLFKVLAGLTAHIDQDGSICINIRQPETERAMVDEMARLGWRISETLNYRLASMPGKGSHKATKDYGEPVYVFRKAT